MLTTKLPIKNKSILFRVVLWALITLITAGNIACTSNEKKKVDTQIAKPFCVPDAMLKNLQIATVDSKLVENEIELTGKVTFNEDQVAHIYPLVSGTVEKVQVSLGDYVKKGQILLEIRSGEIAEFEQQLIAAQNNLTIAEKNESVAEDMAKAGLSSDKDLIIARKELAKSRGELERVKKLAQIYGLNDRSTYTVKSPISGFVVDKNVNNETQIRTDNGTSLLTISDLDQVWVVANVFESDITRISLGDSADIYTLTYPTKVFKGKVDKVYNVLDPQSKVMKIRIAMPNKNYLLKPEMFATVRLRSHTTEHLMAIPSKSIVFDKSKYYIVSYGGPCKVKAKEINIRKVYHDTTYVDGPIYEGETILSNQQLLIFNALNQ